MKKAITVLGLGAAAVAISVSNASAMEQAETTAEINLREQPSATSNKVSELQTGSKLKVISSQDGWTNVETDDGQNGWVSGYYVSNEQSKEGKAEKTQVEEQNIENKGQDIENQNNNEGINVNDQNNNYVNDQNNNKDINANTNINANTSNANVESNVNDRNTESNSDEISNANSEFESNSVNSSVKTSQGKEVSIKSNAKIASTPSLNIRIGPSVSNGVSGIIYKGEIFKVVSKSSNGWYKVILNDGTTGWVSGKYVNLTNEVDNSNIPGFVGKDEKAIKKETSNPNQGTVNSKVGLNVRSGAGTKNAVISTLPSNAVVNIIGKENGWYKIKLANGNIGYVGANYIKANTSANKSTNNEDVSSGTKIDNNNAKKNISNPKSTVTGNKIVDFAQTLLGTKYVWGGTTTNGFDCSGFTQYVYKKAAGVSIPRVSRAQATAGSHVDSKSMKAGDLLYFDTMGGGRTSHVGIYMGNGKFIHASGSAARPEFVKISNLAEKWVKLLGARRF